MMVMLTPKLADVTDRVIGKVKDGSIELFLDNQSIGKVPLSLEGISMQPNFEAKENKIYQSYTSSEGHDARYTDCDEGGWC
jgi:Protein of unknown function (DUF2553)